MAPEATGGYDGVSSRPHNFFDTASYTKPLRFQIYLAAFLDFTQKHFEKVCPLGSSTGTFRGQNSKMAKLAETAVIAGPRASIFEISKKKAASALLYLRATRTFRFPLRCYLGGAPRTGHPVGIAAGLVTFGVIFNFYMELGSRERDTPGRGLVRRRGPC